MDYYIYIIEYNNTPIYCGRSQNLEQREASHNRDYLKGKKKKLYDYLHSVNFNDKITLTPIDIVKTKVEAKRKEIFYMILYTYFKGLTLFQTFPAIRDGF